MKDLFKDYLFTKHILVSEGKSKEVRALETVFSLANLFNIKVVEGWELAKVDMIKFASRNLGEEVPEPFYRYFPESVKSLTQDQWLFDQMAHYTITYGFGNFSKAGHSLLEQFYERKPFKENCEVKEFVILKEEEAVEKTAELVEDLLRSTRPLSDVQYQLVKSYIDEYNYTIQNCASKDTVIRLLLSTKEDRYARFLSLSDVIKVVEKLNYYNYYNTNIKKLNLKNQDRKFITNILNQIFVHGNCNVRECYEKKAIWNGLLHHIHYKPVNDISQKFVEGMRGKGNLSVYSEFEKAMMREDIVQAVRCLKEGKGSGELLRKLNYILSRCKNEKDVQFVLDYLRTNNGILLLQLLLQCCTGNSHEKRTFTFTKYNMLRVHQETDLEAAKRQSFVSDDVMKLVTGKIYENLRVIYKDKLGKVYIDSDMKNTALPLQENISMGGFGVLPKGTRIPLKEGKKLRGFTYWEKVNDIDLSVIALSKDGYQVEFSWRTMNRHVNKNRVITFSGDQTSGYYGGSEYFDIDVAKFKRLAPDVKYLIFCNNVYSMNTFQNCFCKAGYMWRDVEDTGKVFEPKTVDSSFVINADSSFVYLFAIDLEKNDFIWLNAAKNSNARVAATTNLAFLEKYMKMTEVLNVHMLFEMLGTEVVDDPMEADVVVTDKKVRTKEGAELIRSYNFEKIMAYINS